MAENRHGKEDRTSMTSQMDEAEMDTRKQRKRKEQEKPCRTICQKRRSGFTTAGETATQHHANSTDRCPHYALAGEFNDMLSYS